MSTPKRLFNAVVTNDVDAGIARNQSAYEYLSTSGRLVAARVREFFEVCFSHYPEAHRASLAKMISSNQDPMHVAGIFELVMHELIYREIGKDIQIEPEIGSKKKRPDFLVASKSKAPMVIEVTVANEYSSAEHAQVRQRSEVLGALDKVNSPHFWLDLHFTGYPSELPKLTTLMREFQAWIDALPSELGTAKNSCFARQFGDLRITIKPILVKKQGCPLRPFGVEGPGIKSIGIGDNSRSSLKEKFKKYGDLELPFVVALNGCGMGAGLRDVDATLFGTLVYNAATGTTYRDGDGLLSSSRNTRVSAVLYFLDLSAWNIGSRHRNKVTLIHNPWAAYPLLGNPFGVGVATYGVKSLTVEDGPYLADIFDLPADWPNYKE